VSLVGRWLDVRLDKENAHLAARADRAVAERDYATLSRLPLVGLMRTFVADGALVALSLIVGLALLVNLRPTPGGPVYEALGTVGTYILPALGIAVALTTLRRRRALALAGASFVLTFVGLLWLGRSE
jgi:mannose/fructose/N-acetylgalactosamine-specific phosphotransferase system component IIC